EIANMEMTTVTSADITKILKRVPNGRAAGPDGIPWEAWKAAGDEGCVFLADLVNQLANGNEPPDGLFDGIICTVPKKGEDPAKLDCRRPLTLLNCAAKVVSHCMRVRLCVPITRVCGRHQCAFIPGRAMHNMIAEVAML